MWNGKDHGQAKWTTTNHNQGQSSSKEGDGMYMIGLEGSPLLSASSGKPNRPTESESEVGQSCLTLCDPMDGSLPSSAIHEIFQARILEWAAISFSRGSSQPRDRTWVSCIAVRRFIVWATREANWKKYSKKGLELVNRKHITFHQDKARQPVTWMTRQKLLQFEWEVLIPPLYSSGITPPDFHLFKSLQNSLMGKKLSIPLE